LTSPALPGTNGLSEEQQRMLTTRQANKTSRHGVDFARPLDRLTSISA